MLRKVAVCSVVAAMAMATAGNSAAASEMRQGIEVFGLARFMTGDETAFETNERFTDQAPGIEVDPSIMIGAGFGINFNAFLNLNFTLAAGACDFAYTNVSDDIDEVDNGTIFTGDANLDVYLIDGPITPFVTGGLGLVTTSGEREGGEKVSETNPAGILGGGVRFDFGDHLFMKLLYRATLTTLEDAEDNLLFHSGGVAVGWRF